MNKYKSTTLIVILSASIVSGCATIIPPPDRIHWDTAKSTYTSKSDTYDTKATDYATKSKGAPMRFSSTTKGKGATQ